MIDKCNATFKSKMSKQTNCSCDACHDIGRVVKVTLPKTLYFAAKPIFLSLIHI